MLQVTWRSIHSELCSGNDSSIVSNDPAVKASAEIAGAASDRRQHAVVFLGHGLMLMSPWHQTSSAHFDAPAPVVLLHLRHAPSAASGAATIVSYVTLDLRPHCPADTALLCPTLFSVPMVWPALRSDGPCEPTDAFVEV